MARCRLVDGPGCAALALLSMGPDASDVELAAATACRLSAAKNMAVKRRCLVFEPGCAALVSSPVSHDVSASKLRLPLAHSIVLNVKLVLAIARTGERKA